MKTIKELEAIEFPGIWKDGYLKTLKAGYLEALKDVLGLIDEIPQLAILDETYPHVIDAEELKARITGT